MAQNWWNQLLGTNSGDKPSIHQPLVWSDEDNRRFHQWKLEAGFQPFWNSLKKALEAELQGSSTNTTTVSFWKGQGAEGLIFYFEKNGAPTADAQFLFRYCGDRVKELGYVSQLQDHKKDSKGNELLRFYLKPSLKSKLEKEGLPWTQIYGNLLLELSLVLGVPETLKIQATSFQDRQYQKVKHFYEFVGQLMQ